MKTSTKLIIIFFTCIPMSLLAYNFILNVQFKKGAVVRELHPEDNNTYINKTGLPAFKHIVLNGSLDVGNGASEQWMAHVWIGGSNGKRNNGSSLSVVEALKDNLKTSVKNDTLFITFHTTGKYDNTATTWNHRSDIVKIYAEQLKSVSISYANVTIGNNPGATDTLKLIVKDYSRYNVQNLRLQKLSVIAKDSSSFSIGQSNRIGILSYSLQGKSLLNVEENPAKQYFAAHIDSASRIQLTGKASSLQKQLH